MLANAGVYGKRACREATEWRFVPKVIKGGSAEVWKGNVNVARREVRDRRIESSKCQPRTRYRRVS
jgi:hypothetical protein